MEDKWVEIGSTVGGTDDPQDRMWCESVGSTPDRADDSKRRVSGLSGSTLGGTDNPKCPERGTAPPSGDGLLSEWHRARWPANAEPCSVGGHRACFTRGSASVSFFCIICPGLARPRGRARCIVYCLARGAPARSNSRAGIPRAGRFLQASSGSRNWVSPRHNDRLVVVPRAGVPA